MISKSQGIITRFYILVATVMALCSCATFPGKKVTQLKMPEKGYSFYSGNEETLGDIWCKETLMTAPQTGKKVTLLGMYHIADKEFYNYVQQKIDENDVVLAEGVAGNSSLSLSTFFYTYMFALYERGAHWQRLSSQGTELYIPPEKYVNADIEMRDLEQHCSWISTLGQTLALPLAALVIEPSLLISDISDIIHLWEKPENKRKRIAARRHTIFSQSKAQASASQTELSEDSLIPGVLIPRNEQLLKVFEEQMKSDTVGSVLIPWGAAHLQDIEEKLLKRGYQITESKWVRTIAAKDVVDTETELTKNRIINLPYLYTCYNYPTMIEHNLLFQLIQFAHARDYKGLDLGYGQIMRYQSAKNTSYFSLLPLLFGRPLLFEYSRINGETKINALLFLRFSSRFSE